MAPERPMTEAEKEAAFAKMFAPIDAAVSRHRFDQELDSLGVNTSSED